MHIVTVVILVITFILWLRVRKFAESEMFLAVFFPVFCLAGVTQFTEPTGPIPFNQVIIIVVGAATMFIPAYLCKQVFYKVTGKDNTPRRKEQEYLDAQKTEQEIKNLVYDVTYAHEGITNLKDKQEERLTSFWQDEIPDIVRKRGDYKQEQQIEKDTMNALVERCQKHLGTIEARLETDNSQAEEYARLKQMVTEKLNTLTLLETDFEQFIIAFNQKVKTQIYTALQKTHRKKTAELANVGSGMAQITRKASLQREIEKLEAEILLYKPTKEVPSSYRASTATVVVNDPAIEKLWNSYQVDNQEEFWQQYEAAFALAKTGKIAQ